MGTRYSYENQKSKEYVFLHDHSQTPKQDNSLPIGPNFTPAPFGKENDCWKVVLGIFMSTAKLGSGAGIGGEKKNYPKRMYPSAF